MIPQYMLSGSTVDALAQVVVHFLWQGALLGLSAACLLHVWPIRTAHARYAFYLTLLVLLAVCPLVTWRFIHAGGVTLVEVRGERAHAVRDIAALAETERSTAESIAVSSRDVPSNAVQTILRRPDSRLRVAGTWLERHYGWIVSAWLAGICLMAARLLLGAIGVCTLARRRQPIPAELAGVVARLSRRLAFHARPAVHAIERVSQAMAVGIFKPMVLLPAAWISELPSDVLEAVIAHELAHLRRWDLPINCLQRVIETVLFFHPAVWWCSRRLRIEREMCCDDLAQAAIGNRVVYAKALAYLAHRQRSSIESLLAAGIGGAKMVLLERICNVLGMLPGHHGRLYGPSCALVGAVATSLAWIAALGLPPQWQPRTSHEDTGAVVANAEPGPPPDATEPCIPLAEVAQALQPLSMEDLEFKSYWDLSLEDAIECAVFNSKVSRSLGAHYISGEATQMPVFDGVVLPRIGVIVARANADIALVDFEGAMRNLVNDTELAYWELWFAWRNLETLNTALRSARGTWKTSHWRYVAGDNANEPKQEALAREQYFQFKSATQTQLNELFRAEKRLRYVMGVAPTSGRVIRPLNTPTVAKVSFDWQEISEEALERNLNLRRRKWRVKQRELELTAAKISLQPLLDLNRASLRPKDGQGQETRPANLDDLLSVNGGGEGDGELTQEFLLGLQSATTFNYRKKLAEARHYHLLLARERAKLHDLELEVSHQLAEAVNQLEQTYQQTQTDFNRALAAARQVKAVQVAFESETVTIDQLLEAERRRAEAQQSYFRTLLDYQRAIILVHYRKGSLL